MTKRLIDATKFFEEMKRNNPKFRREVEKVRPEYLLQREMILARMEKKMSQRELAKKIKSTQAVISRIESGSVSPSLRTMEKMAEVFGKRLEVRFVAKGA